MTAAQPLYTESCNFWHALPRIDMKRYIALLHRRCAAPIVAWHGGSRGLQVTRSCPRSR